MPEKTVVKRIGWLHSCRKPRHLMEYNSFKQSLSSAGYAEPTSLQIIEFWTNDNFTLLDTYAQNLATTTPRLDLIIAAGGSASAKAATIATNATDPVNPIPVVFTTNFEVNRPPRDSTGNPAMNSTGVCAFTSPLDPERLRQLHLKLPGEDMVGALVNSLRFDYPIQTPRLDKMASDLGLQLNRKDGNPATLIPQAFADWRTAGINAAIVTADVFFNDYRPEIIRAAKQNKIQAMYQWHEFTDEGGPGWSYGTSLMEAYRQAGTIAGQVLDGADPATIPVMQLPIALHISRKGSLKKPRKQSPKKQDKRKQ